MIRAELEQFRSGRCQDGGAVEVSGAGGTTFVSSKSLPAPFGKQAERSPVTTRSSKGQPMT
ncbi:MAG: hypothetical protein ACYSWP_21030 [Planctomycetota bacterium]